MPIRVDPIDIFRNIDVLLHPPTNPVNGDMYINYLDGCVYAYEFASDGEWFVVKKIDNWDAVKNFYRTNTFDVT